MLAKKKKNWKQSKYLTMNKHLGKLWYLLTWNIYAGIKNDVYKEF